MVKLLVDFYQSRTGHVSQLARSQATKASPQGLFPRKGFGLHWCVYSNGYRSPCRLRDARKDIGVQQVLALNSTNTLLNADALAGIAKNARASVSININPPMNVEAPAGSVPKGPQVPLAVHS